MVHSILYSILWYIIIYCDILWYIPYQIGIRILWYIMVYSILYSYWYSHSIRTYGGPIICYNIITISAYTHINTIYALRSYNIVSLKFLGLQVYTYKQYIYIYIYICIFRWYALCSYSIRSLNSRFFLTESAFVQRLHPGFRTQARPPARRTPGRSSPWKNTGGRSRGDPLVMTNIAKDPPCYGKIDYKITISWDLPSGNLT